MQFLSPLHRARSGIASCIVVPCESRNISLSSTTELWYNLDKVDGEAEIVRIGEAK